MAKLSFDLEGIRASIPSKIAGVVRIALDDLERAASLIEVITVRSAESSVNNPPHGAIKVKVILRDPFQELGDNKFEFEITLRCDTNLEADLLFALVSKIRGLIDRRIEDCLDHAKKLQEMVE